VTLGLSNRSVGESVVISLLSIIHNGIILDLVCGFFGGSVRAVSFSFSGSEESGYMSYRSS